MHKRNRTSLATGFTIVELLIVIVIIGILATIVIVAYNGITTKARQVTLQSDLTNSRTKIELANATDGQYPSVATVSANKSDYLAQSKGNTLTYNTNPNQDTYCISALGSDNIMYVISNLAGPYKGNCTGTSSEIATEGDGTPPPPAIPSDLTATPSGTTLQLSWTIVAGATSYELQWRQGTSGSFTNLPVGSVTNYNHTGLAIGKTYQYQVRTVRDTATSDWSSIVSTSIPITDGVNIQDVTTANCPSSKVRAKDARDSRTYWVQKLSDGKCWMLTNLAYAGGGTNTYSDVKVITTSNTLDYTKAYYMIPASANFTTEPANPSTSTNGTGQYGYLYNWCAAMGVQTSTSACMNATAPAPDTSVSICPANWRLPSGNGGEFGALNTAVNSGSTGSDSGLRSSWFAQYGGNWVSGFNGWGVNGYYWSGSQQSATIAYNLRLFSTYVDSANTNDKRDGFAVRCIAAT